MGETFGLGVFRRGGGAACDASEPWGDMSGSFLIMGSVYSWISLRLQKRVGMMQGCTIIRNRIVGQHVRVRPDHALFVLLDQPAHAEACRHHAVPCFNPDRSP